MEFPIAARGCRVSSLEISPGDYSALATTHYWQEKNAQKLLVSGIRPDTQETTGFILLPYYDTHAPYYSILKPYDSDKIRFFATLIKNHAELVAFASNPEQTASFSDEDVAVLKSILPSIHEHALLIEQNKLQRNSPKKNLVRRIGSLLFKNR